MISPDEYIEQRLNDQMGWYDRKSVANQRWFRRLRFAEIKVLVFTMILQRSWAPLTAFFKGADDKGILDKRREGQIVAY